MILSQMFDIFNDALIVPIKQSLAFTGKYFIHLLLEMSKHKVD